MSPTFFLPPNFINYPASRSGISGPIRLGQLIHKINDPSQTVEGLPPLDLSEYDIKVETSTANAKSHNMTNISTINPSIFHKAAQVVGLHDGAAIERLSYENLLSRVADFETSSIDVTGSYVQASLQQPEVQDWVKETFFSTRLYMVTGLLVANPHSEDYHDLSRSPSDGAASDTSAGSSDSDEMDEITRSKTLDSFIPKVPFVYGFRLRQCFFRRGRAGSVAHARDAKFIADKSCDVLPMKNSGSVFNYSGIGNMDMNVEELGSEAEGLFEQMVWDDATGAECKLVLASWKAQE